MPLSHLPKRINFADILVTLFVAAESLASFVAPLRAFLACRSCSPPSAAVGSNDRLMVVHRGRSRRTAFSGVALPLPSLPLPLFSSVSPIAARGRLKKKRGGGVGGVGGRKFLLARTKITAENRCRRRRRRRRPVFRIRRGIDVLLRQFSAKTPSVEK